MEHVPLTLILQMLKVRIWMTLEGSVLLQVDNQLNLIIFIHLSVLLLLSNGILCV